MDLVNNRSMEINDERFLFFFFMQERKGERREKRIGGERALALDRSKPRGENDKRGEGGA